MNDKKVIEDYKSVRAVERAQPDPALAAKIRNDLIRMIDHAIANPNPAAQPETRSLSEIVSDIETDKSKSLERKSFEIHIAKMAERLTHQRTVLTVSGDAPETKTVDEPLPERLRFFKTKKLRPR